ncbi:hypothetical protein [Yeosuana marina]|uniref:hypothetical protein n=1 Tax=Yeosuana marina TaxID=1565536 RepID=UPI00141FEC9B|nr:hypothetical protein [Yeosuana marina]
MVLSVFIFFYWVISHWFFSKWYHKLLGFKEGSYQESFVKIIGTNGILPSLVLFIIALNPETNKELAVIYLLFLLAMALTYLFLIFKYNFPEREYWNVALITINILIISFYFPW